MSTTIDLQQASHYDGFLPSEAQLQQWSDAALAGHRSDAEVTVRIVDAEESQALNRDYRDKDKPTNVLSFPFEAPVQLQLPLLGDLVICAEVVENEANAQKKTLVSHWAHMIVHGCLHLVGYDHIDDDEAEAMEAQERLIMAQLGFDDPYAEREQV